MKQGLKTAVTEKKNLRLGRDEMNLAELPFFLLSKRSPKGVNELHFTYDMTSGKESVRTHLTIKGDPQYGLPTAREEDVVLASLQISRDYNRYQDPRVYFTQRQMLQELGWGTRGGAYKRLEDSLFCLQGVRYRVVGWRDNAKKTYTTKGSFSLISDFELRDSRRRDGAIARESDDEPTLSYFVWGNTLFQSFRTGYLKSLDYELVSKFKTTLSKRLYRYLDKHFNPPHYTRIVLPLKAFAYERMAMSRKADRYEIQRQMQPAINELTEVGFLEQQSWSERTSKNGKNWQIEFRRLLNATRLQPSAIHNGATSITSALKVLVSRGVDLQVAVGLSEKLKPGGKELPFTDGRLEYVAKLYDFKKKRCKPCGPGFLVEGLRRESPFPPDVGFVGPPRNFKELKTRHPEKKRVKDDANRAAKKRTDISKLSKPEQLRLEEAALKRQPATFHEYYDRFRRTNAARFQELRTFLVSEEFKRQEAKTKPGSKDRSMPDA